MPAVLMLAPMIVLALARERRAKPLPLIVVQAWLVIALAIVKPAPLLVLAKAVVRMVAAAPAALAILLPTMFVSLAPDNVY